MKEAALSVKLTYCTQEMEGGVPVLVHGSDRIVGRGQGLKDNGFVREIEVTRSPARQEECSPTCKRPPTPEPATQRSECT